MAFAVMKHDTDPKLELVKAVGDLKNIEIFNNQILVAIYIRPQATKGGILLADQTRREDSIQGKVGLILKKGASAFVDATANWFTGIDIRVNDWIFFRASDGWSLTIGGHPCRILDDVNVKGRVQHPDFVW
jgi:co-chaperonin GroES (HSP10)